ncbi:MAG TPA: alpha/beta hydrolase-fold protein [Pilimelia sp.]|nr:alpha/beta hydrolase-fold protein [Pilimelia sp.]
MDPGAGAACRGDTLAFRLADAEHRLAGVRLYQHAGLPVDRLDFGRDDAAGGWRLELPRPALWRLEYLLELRHHDGGTELVCDPGNPHRVGGAYGDKSVLHCPDYAEPAWLGQAGADGAWREIAISAPGIRAEVWARLWSPAGADDRVVIAHDGPEYDKLAALGHFSAAMVAAGRLPAHHLVLLAPGDRNEWYSASPAYAWALAADVLPRLATELGTTRPVVGLGASLGALAMLHAQRRYPAAFAGLFLQSGSFFQPRYDRHESGFRRYLRMVRFTGQVLRAADGPPTPTMLTCGRVEENLANNRDMARALWRQGYPATLFEVPDAHNYTGWRDAFDPYLTDLLRRVWAVG